MLSDIEIASAAKPLHIKDVAAKLGISEDELICYGTDKAKVKAAPKAPKAKLILVTAVTPTPAGEGKTTVTVGLGDALARKNKSVCIALREPSLGPCFGVKGGAAGGGYAQVVPMEDINLHFTGDFHAVTTAHNLLAATLDNSIYQGNPLNIDPDTITWKRVMDMNERELRQIIIGIGGKTNGVIRESGFDITTASEIMALLCLADDREDLKRRLERIIVAKTKTGEYVTAKDLKVADAMAVILKDAVHPNLVQTLENTPAFVHGGPFANIAHGCNSVKATKTAMGLADYVVTEAGFASDLGAQKFFDIKCRAAGLKPSAVVIVCTVRALKMHGGVKLADLGAENVDAVKKGLANLDKHIENMRLYGLEPIVAVNKFVKDTEAEVKAVLEHCEEMGAACALADVWAKGGEGGADLADKVIAACEKKSDFGLLYDDDMPLVDKIKTVATKIYGADGVDFDPKAKKQLAELQEHFGNMPVCVAKTQNSLSDNPKLPGRPTGFRVRVREAKVSAGAGFVVALAGNIMTMPGLPKVPAAEKIGISGDGTVFGLF